jgi:hypothetical protein
MPRTEAVLLGHSGNPLSSDWLVRSPANRGMLSAKQEDSLMPVGLFRGEEGWAQVDYGTGATIPVPRSKYEANGYKPDFDKLPSEAEYWAAEKDNAKRP